MEKMMVFAAALLAATFAFAQDAEIVKVRGKGIGTDKTEALKDAYRDAVERAVGLYVDAEQMVRNEELVTDQILTHSNAYIEKYEIASENKSANGLVTVNIIAGVRKVALTKKISDVMPQGVMAAQTYGISDNTERKLRNLHAENVSREFRDRDAVSLVKCALEGVEPIRQLVKVSPVSSDPEISTEDRRSGGASGRFAKIKYRLKFEIDQDRYKTEFIPHLLTTLEQISLAPPAIVRFKDMGRIRSDRYGPVCMDGMLDGRRMIVGDWNENLQRDMRRVVAIGIADDVGKEYNSMRAMFFKLSEDAKTVVKNWITYVRGSYYRIPGRTEGYLKYHVALLAKDGSALGVDSFDIAPSELMPIAIQRFQDSMDQFWMIAPLVAGRSKAYCKSVVFRVPIDDLPNVASIAIEPVQ